MSIEPRKPDSPPSPWSLSLDDFMRSQTDALYLKSREGARASLSTRSMKAARQPRIDERREGIERRREIRLSAAPERHAIERRRGVERRLSEGNPSL